MAGRPWAYFFIEKWLVICYNTAAMSSLRKGCDRVFEIKELYDLDHALAKDYLNGFTYPWEALKGIKDLILQLGPTLGEDFEEIAPTVWVHKTAKVFPSAYLGFI